MNRKDRAEQIDRLETEIGELDSAIDALMDDTGPVRDLPKRFYDLVIGEIQSAASALESGRDDLQDELDELLEEEEADDSEEEVVYTCAPMPADFLSKSERLVWDMLRVNGAAFAGHTILNGSRYTVFAPTLKKMESRGLVVISLGPDGGWMARFK